MSPDGFVTYLSGRSLVGPCWTALEGAVGILPSQGDQLLGLAVRISRAGTSRIEFSSGNSRPGWPGQTWDLVGSPIPSVHGQQQGVRENTQRHVERRILRGFYPVLLIGRKSCVIFSDCSEIQTSTCVNGWIPRSISTIRRGGRASTDSDGGHNQKTYHRSHAHTPPLFNATQCIEAELQLLRQAQQPVVGPRPTHCPD